MHLYTFRTRDYSKQRNGPLFSQAGLMLQLTEGTAKIYAIAEVD